MVSSTELLAPSVERSTSPARHSDDSSAAPSATSSRASTPPSPALLSPAAGNTPANVYQIPTTSFDANTGPKGVIADAQAYERARKRSFRRTLVGLSTAIGSNLHNATERMRAAASGRGSDHGGSSSSEEEESDFMRTWRQKRLQELEAQSGQTRSTRRQSPSKRSWRNMTHVDAVGYLDAIERVSSDTVVVVLISDQESAVSQSIEDVMSELARRHEHTRFICLPHTEAEMDPAVVPAVLAYRGGELIANLVSVVDELPADADLSATTMESMLARRQVL